VEKILIKLGEFSGVLGELRNLVIEANREIAIKKEQLDLIKIEQDTRNANLESREKEVKKVEDIFKLREDTQKLIKKQEEVAQALVESQQVFNNFANEQKKKLSEQEEKIKQGMFNIELETKALIKAREDLEKEKTEYKYNFIKGLVKQGG